MGNSKPIITELDSTKNWLRKLGLDYIEETNGAKVTVRVAGETETTLIPRNSIVTFYFNSKGEYIFTKIGGKE
jgi:hypothetical protein